MMSVEPVDAPNDDHMESAPFLDNEVSPKVDESPKSRREWQGRKKDQEEKIPSRKVGVP